MSHTLLSVTVHLDSPWLASPKIVRMRLKHYKARINERPIIVTLPHCCTFSAKPCNIVEFRYCFPKIISLLAHFFSSNTLHLVGRLYLYSQHCPLQNRTTILILLFMSQMLCNIHLTTPNKIKSNHTFGQHIVWPLASSLMDFSSTSSSSSSSFSSTISLPFILDRSCCRHVLNAPPSNPCTNTISAYTGALQRQDNEERHLYDEWIFKKKIISMVKQMP